MPATLTIGGVSYDAWLRRETLEHENTLRSEPDTLRFTLNSESATGAACTKPTEGSEVFYTLPDGTVLFGGVLMEAPETPMAHKAMGYQCSCLDWRFRADRRMLNDRWLNKTAGEIIVAAFAKYAPEFDTSAVDLGGRVLASIRFREDSRLTGMLDTLTGLTGWVWDITPEKAVLWGAPGTQTAPMSLVDGGLNFEGLSVSAQIDQLRNRVVVIGGKYQKPAATIDTFTGDGLTGNFRLTATPHGTDQYVVFEESFGGLDATKWVQTDVSNPTPPAGHISSDGYLVTTVQQGAALSESGRLQVLGGNGTWGAVRLMAYLPIARGDGGRRFEWDVLPLSATGEGRVGLWDPNDQGNLAGEAWGFFLDDGTVKPSEGGTAQTALASVTYTANDEFRVRLVPKETAGATLWVNKDKANNYRASQWVELYDTNTGSLANLTMAAIFNKDFNGRVDRCKVFNRLHDVTLTVAGVDKTVGLDGVDEDGGVDALLKIGNTPLLRFFPDTIPAASAAVVLTFHEGLQVKVEVRDEASIAAMRALDDPLGLLPADKAGIYDGRVEDPKLDTRELAYVRGQQEIEEWGNPIVNVGYRTRESGLRAGQVVPAALTAAETGRDLTGSFLIQSVTTRSLGSDLYEAIVTAGSKLKGLNDYLLDLQRLGRAMDEAEDDMAVIDELVWASDTLTLSDTGSVGGPAVTTTDTLTFTDLGAIESGPLPPYLYGTAQYGLATYGPWT